MYLSLKARWYRDRSDSSLHSGLVSGYEMVVYEGSHFLDDPVVRTDLLCNLFNRDFNV